MSREPRLNNEQRAQLRAMGFDYGVMIDKDVSVVVPGAIVSVFGHRTDALEECRRLNEVYGRIALASHVVVSL